MRLAALLPNYIRWHYSSALKGIATISGNITWFIWHFFSINTLAHSIFAPWERLQEKQQEGEGIEGFFSVLTMNLIMRLTGACIRIFMMLFGFAIIALSFVFEIIFFAAWLLLPVLIAFCFFLGFILLVKPV